MTRGRLTAQIQSDQVAIARLQNQLSTGLRIFLPSDDPAAAQRAMSLQRTIERKEQSLTNLQGAVSSLTTTESALAGVSDSLNALKSQALSVVDTIASEEERQSVVNAIEGLIFELTRVGNSSFASNYLLGGAERSSPAYGQLANQRYVEYLGDERSPQTFVDIGQLFDVGVSGDEVLGGLSESVRGSADLNPQLTPDTRLEQLRGGFGIGANGSIEVAFTPAVASDPTTTAVINLSEAKTIDDVARLIEAGAPDGADVAVTIEGAALRIEAASGTLRIGEVGKGRTAAELGISTNGTSTAVVQGEDLNPTIRLTTRLEDLGGSRARGRIVSGGDNNDLTLTAKFNSAQYNHVTVNYVDGATVGSESASYDTNTNTLTVTVADGESTATQVAAAINANGAVPFTAETDYRDQSSTVEHGSGTVTAGTGNLAVSVVGGAAGSPDLTSGLTITNGDDPQTIDTSSAETVEGLLSLLNDPQYGLEATINSTRNGIDIRTRRSGADFSIGENGGTTATDLGIRTLTAGTLLSEFNHGLGVILPGDNDNDTAVQNTLEITLDDQGTSTTYSISTVDLSTVQDLIDQVAAETGGAVTAELASIGNGLVLTRTDAVDAALPAEGTVSLAGDTLTITADAAGPEGNRNYTFEVVDTGSGGLGASLVGSNLVIDLGGSTPDTSQIAIAASTILPSHTVTSDGTATVNSTLGPVAATVSGGYNADQFTVSGTVAERLGFLADGEVSATSMGATIESTDRNPREVDSVFTTLIRMREALTTSDDEEFARQVNRLQDDIDRVSFGRGEVGVRLQNLEAIERRLADEDVTLRSALSTEVDADLVEVISDFTAKQYALQASLQITGQLLNLTVLDYI